MNVPATFDFDWLYLRNYSNDLNHIFSIKVEGLWHWPCIFHWNKRKMRVHFLPPRPVRLFGKIWYIFPLPMASQLASYIPSRHAWCWWIIVTRYTAMWHEPTNYTCCMRTDARSCDPIRPIRAADKARHQLRCTDALVINIPGNGSLRGYPRLTDRSD